MIQVLLLFLSLASFAEIPYPDWKSFLEHEKGPLTDLFPDSKYLGTLWEKYEEFDVDGTKFPPRSITPVPVSCEDKNLYPTHPQQFTKEYIYGVVAKYDQHKLPRESSSCEVRTRNAQGFCIRSMRAVVAVMSDTYEDSCGNSYRGYWLKYYRVAVDRRLTEENMGTLFALGRTQYPKPNSEFPGEVTDGNTYPVSSKEFLVLSRLLPDDTKKIKDAQEQAFKAGFRKHEKIWIPKN